MSYIDGEVEIRLLYTILYQCPNKMMSTSTGPVPISATQIRRRDFATLSAEISSFDFDTFDFDTY